MDDPVSDHFNPGSVPTLEPRHLDMLVRGSGIDPAVVGERGYRSIRLIADLKPFGFKGNQLRAPGLLLPVWTPDGANGLASYRPDNPRTDAEFKPLKYELPRGAGVRIDVPPRCRAALADPSVRLWVTEGQRKGDALASRGECAVVLLGVWGFKGSNAHGGITLLADLDFIAWNDRDVRLVFDSDVMLKPSVRAALERFTEHLQRKRARVSRVYLPNGADGAKVGVDDFLLEHTMAELEACIEAPRNAPRAAPPTVELLESAPPTMRRPLTLSEGRAYCATWLYIRATTTESVDKKGAVIRHDPPLVETRRELYVVRDDGTVFGPGEQSLDELELDVRLADPPREGRTWRARGVAGYRAGLRPSLADVFARVAAVFDVFVDFDRSLAGQREMCELSACFALATWFSEAFTVLGYPWPNGERGSGKTHWLTCWARTSYLGEVLLSSGSFAALRDLADYGAALAFDDAEVLANPKQADPNKRELLLAGSRRGAAVPLKEPRADGRGWELRWTNAYCPKAYSAIRLPDPVLASRSLIIPLVRTADAQRGNADPAEDRRWPCAREQLQDDLWATALSLLPEATDVWSELDQDQDNVGREFEPWRAVFAIARLAERRGVIGLEQRMRAVLDSYQKEKADGLLDTDWPVLVVRAVISAVSDIETISAITRGEWRFTATHIVDAIRKLAADDDDDAEWATARRVGRILAKLRLIQVRSNGKRWWVVTRAQLDSLARVFCIAPYPPSNGTNGTNDTNGPVGTTADGPMRVEL